jgi:hypothetical protein
VLDGRTGVFFGEQTEDSLLEGLEELAATAWNPAEIRANAERFSTRKFIDGLDVCIRKCLTS